jgi:hypothetical protein
MKSQSPKPEISPKNEEPAIKTKLRSRRIPGRARNFWLLMVFVSFIAGNASGILINEGRNIGRPSGEQSQEASSPIDMANMAHQVNPPEGYQIKAAFGEVGPKLLAAGAMSYDAFLQVYERAGKPVNETQLAILTGRSDEPIIFNSENAYFLLNFFWALGLTNRNTILTEGPMITNSDGKYENFASTGGWSIAAKPITELYASADIISLTPEQQEHLQHVAENVYRPCCNNPTHFPDCNHGMAMLGLLQLMASQDASEDEMFEAAKYVNAYWYPGQSLELATFFKATQGLDFGDIDSRQILSKDFSSGSGYQGVKQWLSSNGLIPQNPSEGGSCGV